MIPKLKPRLYDLKYFFMVMSIFKPAKQRINTSQNVSVSQRFSLDS
jgi:hypothetical protein